MSEIPTNNPPVGENSYVPRHADPEQARAEHQMRVAEDYFYRQAYKRYRAEIAAECGPYKPDTTPEEAAAFAETQRRSSARAMVCQAFAADYAYRMGVKAGLTAYRGEHRKPEPEQEPAIEPQEDPPIAKGTEEYLRSLKAPSIESEPEPLKSTTHQQDTKTGLDILEPKVTPDPAGLQTAAMPTSKRFRDRVADVWRRANTALALYFNHPEKGRRRQVAAVLGGYVLIGAGVWLSGHRDIVFPDINSPPSAEPPPHPTPPPLTEQFVESLQPQGYKGETYEWGAMANQVGADNATPELMSMVNQARANGLNVDTWGSPASGHWGISDVTVRLDDGGYHTYYDTQRKLALIQYFSKLNRDEDDDTEDYDSF